jgi:hypothetical protein
VNSWKVILATLVIFGAGLVTGSLVVKYSTISRCLPHPPLRKPAAPPSAVPDNRPAIPQFFLMRTNFIDKLDQELKLTAIQREHIDRVIRERQEQIKELYQEIDPRVHATLVETRERISMELTPEQQALYEELLRRRPWHPPTTNAPVAIVPTNAPAMPK